MKRPEDEVRKRLVGKWLHTAETNLRRPSPHGTGTSRCVRRPRPYWDMLRYDVRQEEHTEVEEHELTYCT